MDRLAAFPSSLRAASALVRLGPAPALICLPEGDGPVPAVLWLHGRTVSKELESARYLRLVRANIAVVALDLPGHGERFDPALQEVDALSDLLEQALAEIDSVLDALRSAAPRIDAARLAIGGISAGGMISLRRLCDPHPFRCAEVEATAGDFSAGPGPRWAEARQRGLDPLSHLATWRPIPLLALHSQRDQVVPLAAMERFVAALRERHRALGVDPELVRLVTWPETGAPQEHVGFGRVARAARDLAVDFLAEQLAR